MVRPTVAEIKKKLRSNTINEMSQLGVDDDEEPKREGSQEKEISFVYRQEPISVTEFR